MGNENQYNYYKMVRYNIQLNDVELVEMECKSNYQNLDSEGEGELKLSTFLETKSELVGEECHIFMRVTLDFESDGPFYIKLAYKGVCVQNGSLDAEIFKVQSEEQAATFLLPYLRECVSNILSRMQYPIYYLPTIDILESMRANNSVEMQEGE